MPVAVCHLKFMLATVAIAIYKYFSNYYSYILYVIDIFKLSRYFTNVFSACWLQGSKYDQPTAHWPDVALRYDKY